MSNNILEVVASPGEDAEILADIIYVHGLEGHHRETWHPRDKERDFWPAWIGSDFADCRVWTFGYPSQKSRWTDYGGQFSLPEYGRNVAAYFQAKRLGNYPIIFICHSLGGLVVKQVLRFCKEIAPKTLGHFPAKTTGVIFIATPHTGSGIATLADHFGMITKTTPIAKDLIEDNPHILDLYDWYKYQASEVLDIETFAYRENTKFKTKVWIVEPSSADPGNAKYGATPINLDHFEICKPKSRDADLYELITSNIREILERPPKKSAFSPNGQDPDPNFANWFSEKINAEAEKRAALAAAPAQDRPAIQAQLDAIRQEFANPDQAYQRYEARIARLETLLGNSPDETLAREALEAGDLDKAEAIFNRIDADADIADKKHARTSFALGQIAEERIDWHGAAKHYGKAAQRDPSLQNLNRASVFAGRIGDYATALQLGPKFMAAAKSEFGEDSAEYSTALNDHALTLQRTGRYDEAEPLFRDALAITRKALGEEHPTTGISLNNLAALLKITGRYNDAEPLFRDALAITRKALGEEHPTTGTRLNNLAELLQATGRYDEAEPLFRDALATTRKALGEEHPTTGASLNNLAGLLKETGRFHEAEPLFRDALAITRKALGEEHPETGTRLNNLAALLRATGRVDEAEPLYRDALAITRKALGEEHPDTGANLNNLAGLLRATGRLDEAEPLYVEAVRVFETALGPDHPSTKTVKANYESFRAEVGESTQ